MTARAGLRGFSRPLTATLWGQAAGWAYQLTGRKGGSSPREKDRS